MAYDRDLRLRALEYVQAEHSLTQIAAVFELNISTIITWKKRYGTTGDAKTKIHRPVNKKIIPEKLIEYVEEHPDAYLKEIAKDFGCHPSSVLKRLRKLRLREKKEHILQRIRPQTSRSIFRKNQRYSQRKARIYR